MIKSVKLAALAACVVLAAGCATKAQNYALGGAVVGAAVLGPVGGVAAAHYALGAVGALVGAGIGESIGKKLDAADRVHVARSVEKSSTETWTSSKGEAMKAQTVDVTPVKKETTVTVDKQSETTTFVKKQDKWVKE